MMYEDNRDVLVSGSNSYGQLGLDHTRDISIPTLLMQAEQPGGRGKSLYQSLMMEDYNCPVRLRTHV